MGKKRETKLTDDDRREVERLREFMTRLGSDRTPKRMTEVYREVYGTDQQPTQ